jgi:hypothetical protein
VEIRKKSPDHNLEITFDDNLGFNKEAPGGLENDRDPRGWRMSVIWDRPYQRPYQLSSELRERRTYFNIPADGYGERSTDYGRSLFGYDAVGRPDQTTDPSDTVDKTTYNAMGWAVTQETGVLVGTVTTLSVVGVSEYDDDGNLTRTTQPVDSNSANDRVTDMGYDWRNRRVEAGAPPSKRTAAAPGRSSRNTTTTSAAG